MRTAPISRDGEMEASGADQREATARNPGRARGCLMSPMSAAEAVVPGLSRTVIGLLEKKSRIQQGSGQSRESPRAKGWPREVRRILGEYLAVQQRVDNSRPDHLCLVRTSGVVKTTPWNNPSPDATNRKFVRMSLGGVRDGSRDHVVIAVLTSAPCRARSCRTAGAGGATRCSCG